MNKTSNGKVKIGIYLSALLMMGAIAVASNLSNIMAAFPEVNPTTIISYMISVPCLIVIPVTLITGKLMNIVAKKVLIIIGVVLWLVGGVVPYFMNSLISIFVMRCIFGVGLGMVQTLCAALVVENFSVPQERDKTMGTMTSFQMLGTIIFSLVAGNLGKISWNIAFLVHLIAIVSLIAVIICIPYKKPEVVSSKEDKIKFEPTIKMWIWGIAFLIFMVGGQTYANSASSIITEMKLGDSVDAGYSLAIFAFGGLIMGFIFGKVAEILKNMTLSFGCILLSISFLFIIFGQSLLLSYIGAFICGLAFSICMPCIMNGAASSVTQSSSGMAVSVATCLQNVGMALCPYVVNIAGKAIADSGNFSVNQGALITAVGILVILAIVFGFINKKEIKISKNAKLTA